MAFSPDGSLLASTYFTFVEPVRVWDTRTGSRVREFDESSQEAQCIAFSPNGKVLATGGSSWVPRGIFPPGGRIRFWDIATGRVLRRFGNVGPTIQCLAFSPDGESLATGDESGRINLWDVATGREIDSRSAGAVLSIRFARDGKTVFTASADGLVRVWDPQNGRPLRKFTTGQQIRYPPDFTADAKIVAVAKERDGIHLWSTSDGKQLCHIPIPKCAEWILALSPDGHSLFAGSYDGKTGRASFWDIPSGKQKLQLPDDLSLAISFAFNPKGNLLAVAGGAVGFIDPATGKMLGIVAPSQGQGGYCFATCVRFCPDGKRLPRGSTRGS